MLAINQQLISIAKRWPYPAKFVRRLALINQRGTTFTWTQQTSAWLGRARHRP